MRSATFHVNSEVFRGILRICEGAKKDKSTWCRPRGLKGVRLIISDGCRALSSASRIACLCLRMRR
jgi:hypothetical protein